MGSSTNYMKDLVTEIKSYYDEKEKYAENKKNGIKPLPSLQKVL